MGNNDDAVDSRVPDSIDDTLDGRYQLGPVLGRGAMSAVYRATDLLLGRDVAIKIFLPGSGDDSFRARQENEMRLLAAFDHPGLVAALDAGVDTRNDEERAYLVMELAEGRDLRAMLTEGPLTIPETARIGIRLAGALSQVHAKGVIHRDIKPANILVSDDDGLGESVKLADFGVALVMNDNRLTATGFTVGTAQYLSPEQAQGLHLTPASDIYSLGLVLLECLTGKAEYPGTPIETASARLHRAPQIPVELPAPLRSLLEAMTDMDPEKRPGAQEVEQALAEEGIQSGRRTALLPSVPPRQPLRSTTRKQATVTSIRTFTKRRPKTVRGVAAAAVTIPIALLLLTQGIGLAGNPQDQSQPADPGISQADPQPAMPNVPAAPAETVTEASSPAVPAPAAPGTTGSGSTDAGSTGAGSAEVVILPETTQAELDTVPADQPGVGEAPLTGKELAGQKSEGKSGKKSENGNGK
ncbi:serine/threonine protein kinase [Paenarthrobacter sp. CM16]|uniref:serine/threonine-protein kinase n=1 Tax=Paenarthrobacter sp. CM16 TaxID=2738447 RepID=UPI0015534B56|nr:protein kinase [Paenarthrobacter sp. CM16]NQD89086.1 serine/threonine protein kinase [Paenarthrobacter sp. CM16]